MLTENYFSVFTYISKSANRATTHRPKISTTDGSASLQSIERILLAKISFKSSHETMATYKVTNNITDLLNSSSLECFCLIISNLLETISSFPFDQTLSSLNSNSPRIKNNFEHLIILNVNLNNSWIPTYYLS